MADQRLQEYITGQLRQGVNRDRIVASLLVTGWRESDVQDAFASVSGSKEVRAPSFAGDANMTVLPGVIETVHHAWRVYKGGWKTFTGIACVPIILSIALQYFILMFAVGSFFSILIGGFSSVSVTLIVAFVMLLIVAIVITVWGSLALLYAVKEGAAGVGIIDAYRRSAGKIVSLLWIILLESILYTLGLLFLIIPAIIFFIWFLFSQYVLVVEDVRGMKALSRSREYVKGRWFSVFWHTLVFGVGITVVASIVDATLQPLFGEIVTSTISTLALAFISPFVACYLFVLYSNLRTLKERPFVEGGVGATQQ